MNARSDFFEKNSEFMTDDELRQLRAVGMGQRMGFGKRPALLVVDPQRYVFGSEDSDDTEVYPVACKSAKEALPNLIALVAAFRKGKHPIFYSQMTYRRDGRDYANRHLKRPMQKIEGWCLEGSKGVEIIEALAPSADDVVIRKSRPSFFHQTPLLGQLIALTVDTVIIIGGTTSNCIRATAIDAAAWNFRAVVVRDAVVDRIRLSHEVSLMDIERQLGDVVTSADVLSYLTALSDANAGAE